ncbi:MAG TPA: hypothetical protein VFT55_06845 [Planctomycetota bacterium]|nr:hypothetical protein [Planctomycetota bacterium]
MKSLAIAALLTLSGLATAQTCGTLAITGGAPSTTLTIGVSGAAANSFAIAIVGPTLGSTTVPLPGSSLVLGLANPFIPLPLGPVSATGSASQSIQLPAQLPQINLHGQGVVIGFTTQPFGINACGTNVVSFTIG